MATYPKIQKLGAGAFGEVWKVERDPPNGVWIYAAMKIIKVVEELAIFIISTLAHFEITFLVVK